MNIVFLVLDLDAMFAERWSDSLWNGHHRTSVLVLEQRKFARRQFFCTRVSRWSQLPDTKTSDQWGSTDHSFISMLQYWISNKVAD